MKKLDDVIHGKSELKGVIFSAKRGWILVTTTGRVGITNEELFDLVKKGLAIMSSKRRYQDKLNKYYNDSPSYRQKRHDLYMQRRKSA